MQQSSTAIFSVGFICGAVFAYTGLFGFAAGLISGALLVQFNKDMTVPATIEELSVLMKLKNLYSRWSSQNPV